MNTKYFLTVIFLNLSLQVSYCQSLNINPIPEPDSALYRIQKLQFTIVPENLDPIASKINYKTLGILGGASIGAFTAAHIYQGNLWWFDQRRSFHFQVTPYSSTLYFDKMGHAFGGAIMNHYINAVLEASNIQPSTSEWISFLISFAYQSYIEIEDGFAIGYGFDKNDFIADFIGAAYPLAQYYYPILKNIQPRISYIPSKSYLENPKTRSVLTDYEGQKFWLSFNIHELLPKKLSKYWPEFLMLSIGTGLKNYYENSNNKHKEIYIAFDFNPSVLPFKGSFGQFIKNTLNFLHFPLPGLKISPQFKFMAYTF